MEATRTASTHRRSALVGVACIALFTVLLVVGVIVGAGRLTQQAPATPPAPTGALPLAPPPAPAAPGAPGTPASSASLGGLVIPSPTR